MELEKTNIEVHKDKKIGSQKSPKASSRFWKSMKRQTLFRNTCYLTILYAPLCALWTLDQNSKNIQSGGPSQESSSLAQTLHGLPNI